MQVFERGVLTILEGTLFTYSKRDEEAPEFLEVNTTKTKDGKELRYVKFDISVSTASKKQDNGTYKDVYEYHSFTVWDRGGASTEFIDFIANPPSDKLKYRNKTRVKFIGYISREIEEYNGKSFIREEIVDFLHLYKVMGAPKKDDSNEESSTFSNNGAKEKPSAISDSVPF